MTGDLRNTDVSPIGAFAGLALLGLLVVERNLTSTSSWVATHLLYSYQDGFRRRALIGTLLQAMRGEAPVTRPLATALGLAALIVFVLLAALLTASVLRARPDMGSTILPLGVLLVASTHTRALALDNGRFDVLLLSITMLVALLALRRPLVAAVAVTPLGMIALAIHEIALLAVVPLAFALVLAALAAQPERSLRGPRVLAFGAAATGTFAAWLMLTGRLPEEVAATRVAALGRRATFTPTGESVDIHSASTAETMAATLAKVAEVGPVPLLVLIAVSTPIAWIAVDAMRRPDDGPRRVLSASALLRPPAPTSLVIASILPLALMLTAVDHGRWFVLATLNLVVAALVRQALPSSEVRTSPPGPIGPRMLLLVTLAVLLPSPIQGTIAFPGVTTSSGQMVRESLRELLTILGA